MDENVLATIVNSTIAKTGLHISGAEVHLHNCILSGNEEYQIVTGYSYDSTRLYLYNTLIQDGENGILNNYPERTIVYYDSTNIDDNPGWINTGEFPYALTSGSPCINTGTQNLPEGFVLPMIDLTGSSRISGGEVDMGAYEFLFVGIDDDIKKYEAGNIIASPNPFHHSLNIILPGLLSGENIELKLYNLTGNLVEVHLCWKTGR
ncbi:MAG: hypothetical protein MZU84_05745 [Sphingobacterium sp.]|nr:hypothetical protein [Sphingobacterium sp.]